MKKDITPEIEKEFLKRLSTSLDIQKIIKDLSMSEEDALDIFKTLHEQITPQKTAEPDSEKHETIIAYVDGGARGNPGPAGAGAYICDKDGNCIKKLKKYLGTATNNVAEYESLLMALKAGRSMGAENIEVFADSELVVKQVNGEYKVKNETLREIYNKVMAVADEYKEFYISHIPREKNKEADALANKAMDEKG